MPVCRTREEILAAAAADALSEPVRSQEWADRIALIIASSRTLLAEREPQAA